MSILSKEKGAYMMNIKKCLFLCVSLIWLLSTISPAFCLDRIALPCEVLESSEALKGPSAKLNGVRYILLHHANSADRETLSKWLKSHSGTEVKFTFQQKRYSGILCRLAHCFGRGLLIYKGDVKPEKRDIIDVILPSQ